ncbi:MAG: restriction endonuclease subunit S [Kiritimatiellales bacterium]
MHKNAQKKVPELRFPEFEGEWTNKSLSEFLIPTFREVNKPTALYKSIGVRSHAKGTFQKNDFDPTKVAMEKLFEVREGDLIVNITFAWEGAIAIAGKYDDGGLVSHRFPTYVFNNDIVCRDFFRSVFVRKRFRSVLELISPGGAGRNRVLSKSAFLNIQWDFPPILQEQQKIAALLSAVDRRIERLEKKRNLLKEYKKGLMQKLFSQTLRFTDDNGRPFPDWEEKRLGDVAEVNPYTDGFPDSFIYIDLESVVGGLLIQENQVRKENAPSRAQRVLKKGDILFQLVRPYQKNNFFFDRKGGFVASTGYAQLRTNQNKMFLYHWLHIEDFVRKVLLRCTGTSYPAINSRDLESIRILMPCIQEQKKIADCLSAMDRKIEQVEKRILQAREFKKGLLQKMFV